MGSRAYAGHADRVVHIGTSHASAPHGDLALHPRGHAPTRRRSSQEVDRLRARALRGDILAELTDAEREWVWRSLLKGVRVDQALVLAEMESDEVEPALARIRRWYSERRASLSARPRARSSAALAAVPPPPTPSCPPVLARARWPFRRR
jgi:hypothetical protein